METTQLYVELIIIGLETSIWMCIIFVNIIGKQVIGITSNILNNLSSSLLLVGVLYILGLLMDRLSELIYKKVENKIRRNSGFEEKTSILIWEKHNKGKYFEYAKTKIKILRASTINVPLISISLMWYIWNFEKNNQIMLSMYVLLLGGLFTWVSWKSHLNSLKSYFDKARLLELKKE